MKAAGRVAAEGRGSEGEGKQSEQEAREQNPCWLPFRRKISCLFMRPMSYLLHKGQSVHLFKVSVFPLSSPLLRVINAGGYVIIGPRRITGLADCDDCIKAHRTRSFFFFFFVSVSAHLQMSSLKANGGWNKMAFLQRAAADTEGRKGSERESERVKKKQGRRGWLKVRGVFEVGERGWGGGYAPFGVEKMTAERSLGAPR